jgi:predicted PurR-regulated permease PerM
MLSLFLTVLLSFLTLTPAVTPILSLTLNEVSSKFIDVANGDSQKYADLVSNFDDHVRELREKNTSSNTGVTNNINNDADDILDKSTPLDFHHPVVAFSSVLLSCSLKSPSPRTE